MSPKKSENIFIKNKEIIDDDNIDIKTIEKKYQKKTQIEHILSRPDTYIGDISIQNEMMWIWNNKIDKIIKKEIKYVPGLYKIFDEILVNARDHNCNDATCNTIKVQINQLTNTISVWNNGKGIEIIEHSEHKLYIPEMVFGELLTSSNYDDTQKRTTGGRNGYGAKLTNIFSTFFSIETIDNERNLKYYQEFTNNLSNRTKPVITKINSNISSYTIITFKPDLQKFNLNELSEDIIALMSKRVIDIAGVTNNIKVYLNDKKIDVNNFKKYISLYDLGNEEEIEEENSENKINNELIYEEFDRWKVGIKYIPDSIYEQISFVNGICTYHGGNHVDYVVNKIIKKLEDIIIKKYKDAKIKHSSIKDNLVIFIDTIIDNPSFTSQTKETLKSKISDFGSTYEPSDKIIKKLASTGLVDQIINIIKLKEQSILKKTDGKKTLSVKGVPKLEDANWAGDKKKSILCKLILTEGDSAKALAMAGISVIGSDKYGVFPLKGKLLNVREATPKKLLENEEIINLKKILGLQHNKEYKDLSELRYGGIITMCDQDSVTSDTPLLLRKNNLIDIKTIDNITSIWKKNEYGKEIGETDYEIWTDNGWTKIIKVIKHRVNKRIFRILTNSGVVDVTEDHSLLNKYGNKVSPKDVNIGDELLHSFPKFDNIINNNYNISIEEAYVMGLFFSAGSCGIYNWQYVSSINDEPIISWLISLNNLDFLKKAKKTLTTLYNYTFNIVKCTKGHKLISDNDLFNLVNKYRILFYESQNTDKKYNKKIPLEIINNTHEVRNNFLIGFFDGLDEKLSNNNILINSKITAQGLYTLCKSLGYNVSININKSSYSLKISIEKQLDSNNIKEIIDLGIQNINVYDLETTNHHFAGGIGELILHNTDGFHIKGLLMNFFHYFWPSLLENNDFIFSLATPIVKATKGKDIKVFYNISDYETWKESCDYNKYNIKYYKGLGTSTKEEGKEYFNDIDNKLIKYTWNFTNTSENIDDNVTETLDNKDILYRRVIKDHKNTYGVSNRYINDCTEAITLAFERNRSNCRKVWLNNYDQSRVLSNTQKNVSVVEFVHKELIHFSNDNIHRSIPSIVDGLKPSTRKILYGTIIRKLFHAKDEIKVGQLSGYIADKTSYHHGEASLTGAIIGMAQNFIGSNNINLLYPSGQFGCLDPYTEILMWDGNIKLAKDIKIDDHLIGDDGNKRIVLQTTNGYDMMYEISNDFYNFKVNSEHILTLYFDNNNSINYNKVEKIWYCYSFDGNTINKYIVNDNNISKIINQIKNHKKDNIIDIKIKNYIKLSDEIKNNLYMISNYNIINWEYQIVDKNPYEYGLLFDKYPVDYNYIINKDYIRYEVFKGCFDKFGTVDINNNIIINNLDKEHIDAFNYLSQSLGYFTKIYNNTLFISLSNNLSKFQVFEIGINKFYGWKVDKNERFLLGNFIITHNSRLMGGKDSASPRYIFTYLNELTRIIFREEDDNILNYLNDDGIHIEPEWYCPIIPMILVNGSSGIGTGFSTDIDKYNPLDIVENLKLLMDNQELKELKPYYRNYTGKIEIINKNEYMIYGTYEKLDEETIRITELPINVWTTSYKEFLEQSTEKNGKIEPFIDSYKCNYTDETIDFTIKMNSNLIKKLENNNQLYKKLKLKKPLTINNMYLYNAAGQIKKYYTVNDIIIEFYEIRLKMYTKRKEYLISKLISELDILKWKKIFIEKVLNNEIKIYNEKKINIINKVIELNFPKLSNTNEYFYITEMPLFNLTQEKIDELIEKYKNKELELEKIKITSEIDQWKYELDEFIEKYKKWNDINIVVKKKIKKITK